MKLSLSINAPSLDFCTRINRKYTAGDELGSEREINEIDTALAKILAQPMELLRHNAVTWELQSFGTPGLQF